MFFEYRRAYLVSGQHTGKVSPHICGVAGLNLQARSINFFWNKVGMHDLVTIGHLGILITQTEVTLSEE